MGSYIVNRIYHERNNQRSRFIECNPSFTGRAGQNDYSNALSNVLIKKVIVSKR
jgi:hypothetical protein